MTVNRKPTGTASSIPVGIAWGVNTAVVLTLTGTYLTAKMIDHQIIQRNHSGYAVMIILILSSWLGALTAARRIKRRRFWSCLAAGGTYMLMLLIITALFFGGQYSGVGETGLLILCGSLLGAFTQLGRKNSKNSRKIRVRNC